MDNDSNEQAEEGADRKQSRREASQATSQLLQEQAEAAEQQLEQLRPLLQDTARQIEQLQPSLQEVSRQTQAVLQQPAIQQLKDQTQAIAQQLKQHQSAIEDLQRSIQQPCFQTALHDIQEHVAATQASFQQLVQSPILEAVSQIQEQAKPIQAVSQQFAQQRSAVEDLLRFVQQPSIQSALHQLQEQNEAIQAAFQQVAESPIASTLESLARSIDNQRRQMRTALQQASDLATINAVKSLTLGDKGALTGLSRSIGQIPKEARPAVGQLINKAKREVEIELAEKAEQVEQLNQETKLEAEHLDVTLPGRPRALGHRHVITQTVRDIVAAFVQMGFEVVEGPEIELDRYNFELLNIPPEHPARSLHDTFYIAGNDQLVLRTHTSPNQIRVMQREKPPIRVVVPGKCYRDEATDPTHEAYFQQVEGLAVDKNITLADLKGTLAALARALFGQHRQVRFRCDYFPYVEPGVDLAIDCLICGGKGCKSCKYTGFLEIMGAGMVHPQVLRNGGIDPDEYSGFAFGMGPERIAMLRHSIDDIRLFYGNDLRFLRQFS